MVEISGINGFKIIHRRNLDNSISYEYPEGQDLENLHEVLRQKARKLAIRGSVEAGLLIPNEEQRALLLTSLPPIQYELISQDGQTVGFLIT